MVSTDYVEPQGDHRAIDTRLRKVHAVSQILRWMLGVDAAQVDPFLPEPSTETGCQPNPPTDRRTGISLSARRVRKPVEPCCKRTFRCLRRNHLVIDDMPHVGLIPPLDADGWSPNYVAIAALTCRQNQNRAGLQDIVMHSI